jgi:hypothetical protein
VLSLIASSRYIAASAACESFMRHLSAFTCEYSAFVFSFDKDWTNQFPMDMDAEMDDNESKTPRVDSSLNTPVAAMVPMAAARRRVKFCEMTPDQIAITEIREMRRVPSWSDLTTVDSSLSPGKPPC